ncbi:hypothetical protein K504DRAFT_176662 [Pleomassaria siparia CBS 279.74]|uniref:Uncharacterized protein n=1 Tax=Pleomassaria siparia CBS 279.74 TaxID=1314801 RepID=A0A6G1JS29_9PLEO|nr:hypothetical protein K504DRAFT_176662 [Pleomassaria siparia CBS 279.74]
MPAADMPTPSNTGRRRLDRVKDALNIHDAEYELIYCEIESAMFSRGILGRSLAAISCKGRMGEITRCIAKKFPDVFSHLNTDEQRTHTTAIARRCNHNNNRVYRRRTMKLSDIAGAAQTTGGRVPGEGVMELGSSAGPTSEEGVAKGTAAVHKREEEDSPVGRLLCTSEADRPAILAEGSAADNMQRDVADAALSHPETGRPVPEREQIPDVAARHCEKQLRRGRRATTRGSNRHAARTRNSNT